MVRRLGSSRRAPGGPGAVWPRRLALLVVALGIVLMHHVVGAHQHAAPDTPPTGTVVDVAHPGDHGAPSTAALHQHPGGGHEHPASMFHLCLAALAAAVVLLLVLVLVAAWWRPGPRRLGAGTTRIAAVPRPPPVPTRLAELQVLRL
ncbi:DUF6153 family protein [Actinomycetospora sp. NBRC 106375]|uniref:DUF6153 family protein n=1 Tax=Actinomycetospora sp. NBRC 106375 TaxID=3032207 RepID=UPI002552942C|nr:DUF6153 family protein [Actinomycetospora sp. NBRC 106375]